MRRLLALPMCLWGLLATSCERLWGNFSRADATYCENNTNCATGQACNVGTHRCESVGAQCSVDMPCPASQRCDVGSEQCVLDCGADGTCLDLAGCAMEMGCGDLRGSGSDGPEMPMPPVALRGVWASSPSDVWVVGDQSTILHYDGFTWKRRSAGLSSDFVQVGGMSSTDVWIVGSKGRGVHWDGTFSVMNTPATIGTPRSLWTMGTTTVLASTSAGLYSYSAGNGWSLRESGDFSGLHGVSVLATERLFVGDITNKGILSIDAKQDPPLKVLSTVNFVVHALCAYGMPQVEWAFGDGGLTARAETSDQWTINPSSTSRPLRGAWCASDRMFVVGDGGVILQADATGTLPMPVPSPTTANLLDVWATDASHAWAVGENGTILVFVGGNWKTVPSSQLPL